MLDPGSGHHCAACPDCPRPAAGRVRWSRLCALIVAVLEWLFGALTLIVGLAVLATIPVAQLLSLGYLLEVSGRVAPHRRICATASSAFAQAARLGRMPWASRS